MILDIHVGNLTTKYLQNILCSIMQQRFCHIYTYILRTLFQSEYFEIETSNPFVQTRISGKQAISELQGSRRMPKWQYVCDVFCFVGKHENPSEAW